MKHLSGKEKKQINENLPKGYEIDKKDEIIEQDSLLLKNKEPYLIIKENGKEKIYLPHLKSIPEDKYKKIYVDKGTIPYVIKGADVMRPGITKIDDNIEENEIILVKDENHNKTIALGYAILNSQEMNSQEKGKSIKVYHYVSDEYY